MDAETVKNECEVIIGFEHNFLEKGVAVVPLVPFVRNAKYLTIEGHHVTIPSGHVGVVTEVHFGVIISQEATEISKDHALDYVNGYVVALNSRLRDDEYKKADDSEPFAKITDFKDAIVISNVVTKELLPHPNSATIWASLNGKECQRGNLTDARMSVQELIEKASQLKTLRAGDLVLSGTPAGSFYVKVGDTVEIGIEGIIRTEISVQKSTEVTTTIPAQEQEFRPKDKEFP
uniref:Fumarylacetoacetase-like C-terminal domain-containing protein n=1 Tax=Panagrolaimus sp. ES5 TaxID=591445 RepID=A0AC34FG32_9BILA